MLKPFKISSEVISRISSPILILAAAILSNSLTPNLTVAETKQNESIPKVAFRKAPRLLDIYTTFDRVRSRSAIYYFDITIPEDSGAPLQKVEIELRQGQDRIKYKLERTVAYLGTHSRRGDRLALETVSQEEKTEVISVVFANSLPPGTTFTVGLKPVRNPDFDGIYVFGVTVFPQGENPFGLYLGSRRLYFRRGYDGFFVH